MIKTILFDLDGTLLPMDMDLFIKEYFKNLSIRMSKIGYEPNKFIETIWEGTKRMVINEGDKTNEEVFWDYFSSVYGNDEKAIESFNYYYENEFAKNKETCFINSFVPKLINKLKQMNFNLVLATNPLFPNIATKTRTSWTGLTVDDFSYYTVYENSHYCKPNLKYFVELLEKINAKPEECLMVGNDVDEDMVASKLGMKVFLITDCLVNRRNKDISNYPNGNFQDLLSYVENINKGLI